MITTTPLFTAVPIVLGRRVFLAGIDRLPVTLRAGKNVKSEARRRGADRVVSDRYRDSQKNPQWVMGLVNWAKLALPKDCKDGYVLAVLIRLTTERQRLRHYRDRQGALWLCQHH